MPDRDAVEEFYATVNARAEAAILAGEPITGAHHRSLEAEIARHRADRDAAPAAAEGADDELYAEFLRGFMPEIAPTSIVGLTLRHAWDAALEVYGVARTAPPAAPRADDHRPCDLPQCDHRCNACGRLWPCEDVVDWACRFCGCDIDRHPPMGERSTRYCLTHDMDVCPQYEPSAAREAARGEGEATP